MSLPGVMHPQDGDLPGANAPICRIIAGPNGAGNTSIDLLTVATTCLCMYCSGAFRVACGDDWRSMRQRWIMRSATQMRERIQALSSRRQGRTEPLLIQRSMPIFWRSPDESHSLTP